jgi:membrane dipeptidase
MSLHKAALVVDCHNDLPIMLSHWFESLGQTHYFSSWISRWRQGGVKVQVIPIYLEPQTAEAGLRQSLLLIETLHRETEKNQADVALCLSGRDIDAAVEAGKVAIVIALEGCPQIGTDIALFRTFYRLGVRMASFTHLGRTLLADGSAEDEAGSRLPSSGVAAIKEMERLGMLVDVSHLSMKATGHVLELATRPVIASHSSARKLCDHHRNLPDEHLKAIAATGGVIGVNVLPAFIDSQNPSLERVVDHLEHISSVAGIHHVGLGPDFIAEWARTVYPKVEMKIMGTDLKESIAGLETTEDLPNLTEAMQRRGFAEADIRKILGENFMRVFREVLK